ncbi:MAG: hypothetical protein NVV63_01915 [Opitutus sp.]|nr:hypothetical protein [Opitutus sp.]
MINSTTSTDRAVPTPPVAPAGHSGTRPLTQRPDQLSTENVEHLKAALAAQPEIRPEVVERAKALAADPEYPSLDILKRVSGMILAAPDLSEDQS